MTTPTKTQGFIPPLSRVDLYASFGLMDFMEPETQAHLEEVAKLGLLDAFDSPHEHAWHVSMHASEFPGDPLSACERYLAYRMANIPSDEPTPPWVSMTGDVGKAGELTIAKAWFAARQSLAVPEDPTKPYLKQLGFVSPDYWATGSTDLPILPFGWKAPHIIEIKCKAHDVVEEMIQGKWDDSAQQIRLRGPDKKHVLQLKATIGFGHEDYDWGKVTVEEKTWKILRSDIHERLGLKDGMLVDAQEYQRAVAAGETLTFELDPPTTGQLYYWSRSWPRTTKSFHFSYDADYMAKGREVLARVRQAFIDDVLPQRDPSFQYGLDPCRYCNFSRICRDDSGLEPRKRKPSLPVTQHISESHAVRRARELRGKQYSYARTRAAVFARWGDEDPIADRFPVDGSSEPTVNMSPGLVIKGIHDE